MAEFKDLQSDAGLGELNEYLASRSYIDGYQVSGADTQAFGQVANCVDCTKFPHVFRWYNHIAALIARNAVALKPNPALFVKASSSGAESKAAAGGGKKDGGKKEKKEAPKKEAAAAKPASPKAKPASPKASPKPAPAAAKKPKADDDSDDDFSIDLDDDGGDSGAAAAIAAKKKQEADEAAKAKKKNAPIAKSSVVLDISPMEAETDLTKLEAEIRKITMEGLHWGACDRKPVAYGVYKLRMVMTIVDDLVSVDDIQEQIEALEDCQSTTIFAFNKI